MSISSRAFSRRSSAFVNLVYWSVGTSIVLKGAFLGDEDSGYFLASGENLIDCLSPLFPANFFVTVFPFLSVGFLALLYGDV